MLFLKLLHVLLAGIDELFAVAFGYGIHAGTTGKELGVVCGEQVTIGAGGFLAGSLQCQPGTLFGGELTGA